MENLLSLNNVVIYICAYLIGSVPFGYLITRLLRGLDIRKYGSGNIGATNVARILGKKWGILTFILDFAKGIIAIAIAKIFSTNHMIVLIAAYLSILGHIAPVWFMFKGGKGVSTTYAALAILMPLNAVIVMLIWIIMFAWKRISSVSAISSFLALPFISIIRCLSLDQTIFCTLLSITILIKHRSNILRIIDNTEQKLSNIN